MVMKFWPNSEDTRTYSMYLWSCFTSSVQARDRELALFLGANGYIHKVDDLAGFTAVAKQILKYFLPGPLLPNSAKC